MPAPRTLRSILAATVLLTLLSSPAHTQTPKLTPARTRHAASDLEVTGLIPSLRPGQTGFLTYAQLASLPQVPVEVADDENLPHPNAPSVRVQGVLLTVLREALNAAPASDVLDAWCTDQYRAHYPASYLAAHQPILALTLNGLKPTAWAAATHAYNPAPYLITHAHFTPAFRVLAHDDQAQIPTNVIRLNFTTAAQAFGPITPPGPLLPGSAIDSGFTIAKQNCLRCHFSGNAGGTKSGRDWSILSLWARQKPDYFKGYIHNPRAEDPKSEMPAFPAYDEPTLKALLAYFQSFPSPSANRP